MIPEKLTVNLPCGRVHGDPVEGEAFGISAQRRFDWNRSCTNVPFRVALHLTVHSLLNLVVVAPGLARSHVANYEALVFCQVSVPVPIDRVIQRTVVGLFR